MRIHIGFLVTPSRTRQSYLFLFLRFLCFWFLREAVLVFLNLLASCSTIFLLFILLQALWETFFLHLPSSKQISVHNCLSLIFSSKSFNVFQSQALAETGRPNESHLLVDDRNKYHSMLIRAYSSLWMVAAASVVVYLGHLYIWAMVVIIQIFMVRELFNLRRQAHEDKRLPGFRLLNW